MHRYSRSRAYRTALLVLFAAVLFSPLFSRLAHAAAPDPIFLRFEVSVGPGLHVLSLRVNVEQSGEAYSIAVEAETRSLADLFVDLRSRLHVRGWIVGGGLLRAAMCAETRRRGAGFCTR